MTTTRSNHCRAGGILIMVAILGAPLAGPARADTPSSQQKQVKQTAVDPADPVDPVDQAQPAKPGHIQVALTGDQILVDGQATTLDGFAAAMKAAAGADPEQAAVQFNCADEVSVVRVYEVQQQLQTLRMKKVMFGGKEGGRVPMALPSPEAKAKLAALPQQDRLDLKVRGGRQVNVDGADVPQGKVGEMIRQRIAGNPKIVVSLTMATDTTFKELKTVLEQLRTVGAQRIVMNESGT